MTMTIDTVGSRIRRSVDARVKLGVSAECDGFRGLKEELVGTGFGGDEKVTIVNVQQVVAAEETVFAL